MAPRTRLGELEIQRVLGMGGFGIVYLAHDHALQRDVALKEYMPASLARRGQGSMITVRSASFADTYAAGLRSFLNEARLLARFDHPSLVKVYRFWEGNGTAYMEMPCLAGRTLRDARRVMPQPPDEHWLRALLDPLLGALDVMHREGVYHRDIAPDNIVLADRGVPVLLDFGAARHVIGDRTQSLTAILKPSYAPIEQYAEMTQFRQGPWTDLYALGAVVHFMLHGTPPAPSTARAVQDETVPLQRLRFPGVSQPFLAAIDWTLAVRPQERPQSVAALRAVLDGGLQAPPLGGRRGLVAARGAPGASSAVTGPQARPPALPTPVTTPTDQARSLLRETASAPLQTRVEARPAWWRGAAAALALLLLVGAAFLWQDARDTRRAESRGANSIEGRVIEAMPPSAGPGPVRTETLASAPAASASFTVDPPVIAPVPSDTTGAAPSAAPTASAATTAPDSAAAAALATVAPPASAATEATALQAPPPPVARERRPRSDTAAASAPAAAALRAATAREACGDHVMFAIVSCLERECRRPRFSHDPECVEINAAQRGPPE